MTYEQALAAVDIKLNGRVVCKQGAASIKNALFGVRMGALTQEAKSTLYKFWINNH